MEAELAFRKTGRSALIPDLGELGRGASFERDVGMF